MTTLGLFIDPMVNVRNRSFPAAYSDHFAAWSFHAEVGASLPAGWAIVQDLWGASGGLTGAWQYSELQNSTTTNARTWTCVCNRFWVYGGTGSGLGHLGFSLDGAAAVDVNQDDGNPRAYQGLLYDSGPLTLASHTLAIARISGLAAFDRVRVGRSR